MAAHLFLHPAKQEHNGQLQQGGKGHGLAHLGAVAALINHNLIGKAVEHHMADKQEHQPHQHQAIPGVAVQKAALSGGCCLWCLRYSFHLFIVQGDQQQNQQRCSHAQRHCPRAFGIGQHTDEIGSSAIAQGSKAPGDTEIHLLSAVDRSNAQGIDQRGGQLKQHHAQAIAQPRHNFLSVGSQQHQAAPEAEGSEQKDDPFQCHAFGAVGIGSRQRLEQRGKQPCRRNQQANLAVVKPHVQQKHTGKAHDGGIAHPIKALDGAVAQRPIFDDHKIRPFLSLGLS